MIDPIAHTWWTSHPFWITKTASWLPLLTSRSHENQPKGWWFSFHRFISLAKKLGSKSYHRTDPWLHIRLIIQVGKLAKRIIIFSKKKVGQKVSWQIFQISLPKKSWASPTNPLTFKPLFISKTRCVSLGKTSRNRRTEPNRNRNRWIFDPKNGGSGASNWTSGQHRNRWNRRFFRIWAMKKGPLVGWVFFGGLRKNYPSYMGNYENKPWNFWIPEH